MLTLLALFACSEERWFDIVVEVPPDVRALAESDGLDAVVVAAETAGGDVVRTQIATLGTDTEVYTAHGFGVGGGVLDPDLAGSTVFTAWLTTSDDGDVVPPLGVPVSVASEAVGGPDRTHPTPVRLRVTLPDAGDTGG